MGQQNCPHHLHSFHVISAPVARATAPRIPTFKNLQMTIGLHHHPHKLCSSSQNLPHSWPPVPPHVMKFISNYLLCLDINSGLEYPTLKVRSVVVFGIKSQRIFIQNDWPIAPNTIKFNLPYILCVLVNLGFENCKQNQRWVSGFEIKNQGICFETSLATAKDSLDFKVLYLWCFIFCSEFEGFKWK